MTAVPSFEYYTMDFSSLEDKMDLASSPFPHVEEVEDLDYEFDQMDNKPPELTSDNFMDDTTEPGDGNEEMIQGDVEIFEDENPGQGIDQHAANDFDMNEDAQENQDDEEILYEEEEESTALIRNGRQEQDNHDLQHQQEAEEFLEPDEALDSTADEVQLAPQPGNDQVTFTDQVGEQNEQQGLLDLKTDKNIQHELDEDEQLYRDDGDGPTVNPTATEFEGDIDAQRQDRPKEAEVQLEESFEEILDAEQGAETLDSDAVLQSSATADHLGREEVQTTEHGGRIIAQEDAQAPHDELHSIKLVYLGEEMSLFPPKEEDSSTYFLADSGLAFKPVEKLLESCREILTGSIGHDDELVLDVPTLGLHICEDSKYASQITLSQVIDVFLSLHHNESRETVEPLYCNLSSRVCLASQYAYLSSAAQEGRTFSEIVAEHAESPYEEDAGADDAAALEEALGGQPQNIDEKISEPTAEPTTGLQSQGLKQDDGNDILNDGHENEATVADDAIPTEEREHDTEAAQSKLDESASDLFSEAEGSESSDVNTQTRAEEKTFYDQYTENAQAVVPIAPEAEDTNSSHTAQGDAEAFEPSAGIEVSEYLEEAFEEPLEEEAEELQEQAEDQSLLEAEFAPVQPSEEQEAYNADEFLINSDEEVDGEDDLEHEDAAGEAEAEQPDVGDAERYEANGKHAAVEEGAANGFSASAIPPTTPSKKVSKRKVIEEEEFILDMDTPDPKRRRPS